MIKFGYSLWRRKPGKPIPFFGWLGDLAATKSLLILMTIKYKTAQAKIDRLEREIQEAEIRSLADPSDASSFDFPGSTLMRSRPPTSTPSGTTSAKPGSNPT